MLNKVKNFFSKILPSRRKIIQLYAALLFNANIKGFITGGIYTGETKGFCLPGMNCYSCPGAVLACPLGSLQNALSASKTKTPTFVLGIILLYCITLGRTICGWLCPAGFLQELLYKIKTPKLQKSKVTRALSYIKYVLLVVLVIAIPLVYGLMANNVTIPAFCKYICPVGTFEGAIFLLANKGNAHYYEMLGALFNWKLLLMIIIACASIFIYRFFCRFLCPLGALYGLFNKLSILGFKIDKSKCDSCGACVASCKMDVKEVGDHECIECGECRSVCHTNAISWKKINLEIKKEKEIEDAALEAEVNAIEQAENKEKVIKKRKAILGFITTAIMTIVLVGAFIYYNIDFGPKLYLENDIVSSFTTKLSTDEKEFNIKNHDGSTILYFYDEYNKEEIESLSSFALDTKIVLIGKYDKRDTDYAQFKNDFINSNMQLGYDSVNTTEILKFMEEPKYPALVGISKRQRLMSLSYKVDSEVVTSDYINSLNYGGMQGDDCLPFDVLNVESNEIFNIKNYRGKVIVLNFWYVDCGPCKVELPDFNTLYKETSRDEVEMIAIHDAPAYSYKQVALDVRKLRASEKYDVIPFGFVDQNTGKSYFNALGYKDAYPTTLILDKNGVIKFAHAKALCYDDLKKEIKSLL